MYAVTPGGDGAPQALLSGKGKYQKLAWDRPQEQLAFFSDRDTAEAKPPLSKVYYWDRKSPAAVELVSSSTPGMPQGMVVSDKGPLAFTRDGRALLVPAAPAPPPEKDPAQQPPADERVLMDLWHYQDDFVQPMQKVRANRDRNRTYTGIWHLADRKYVQLADEMLPAVTMTNDSTRAAGNDDRAYRRMVDYDGAFTDIYVVDTRTGERQLAVKQLRAGFGGAPSWSPDGRWAAFFRDRHWHVLDATSLQTRNLTETLPVKFFDEDDDTPDSAGRVRRGHVDEGRARAAAQRSLRRLVRASGRLDGANAHRRGRPPREDHLPPAAAGEPGRGRGGRPLRRPGQAALPAG